MKSIILAAGYATRLYPLTLSTPKALLEIGNETIIDHIIRKIDEIDQIDEIFIVTNHRFIDNFNQWNENKKSNKKITIIDDGSISDETKLGAIGDIKLVINKYNINDDVLIIASDQLGTFSLAEFYNYYNKVNKSCIMTNYIEDLNELKRMGVVTVDDNNKIIKFEEKPKNPSSNIAAYAGYIYTKEDLKYIEQYLLEGNNSDSPGYFPQWLCKREDVYAYVFSGECYDIGTHESYKYLRDKFSIDK